MTNTPVASPASVIDEQITMVSAVSAITHPTVRTPHDPTSSSSSMGVQVPGAMWQ